MTSADIIIKDLPSQRSNKHLLKQPEECRARTQTGRFFLILDGILCNIMKLGKTIKAIGGLILKFFDCCSVRHFSNHIYVDKELESKMVRAYGKPLKTIRRHRKSYFGPFSHKHDILIWSSSLQCTST
jgi:hypothetical protein